MGETMRNPEEFTFESQGAGKKPEEKNPDSETRSKIGSLIESSLAEAKAEEAKKAASIAETKANINKLFDENLQNEMNQARKTSEKAGEQPLDK